MALIKVAYFKIGNVNAERINISDFELLILGRLRGDLYAKCNIHHTTFFHCYSAFQCYKALHVIHLISSLEHFDSFKDPDVCRLLTVYSMRKRSIETALIDLYPTANCPEHHCLPSLTDSTKKVPVPFLVEKIN